MKAVKMVPATTTTAVIQTAISIIKTASVATERLSNMGITFYERVASGGVSIFLSRVVRVHREHTTQKRVYQQRRIPH
ncbi:hypothetical protein GCM10025298_17310 [Natronobiforma cellulositropha]